MPLITFLEIVCVEVIFLIGWTWLLLINGDYKKPKPKPKPKEKKLWTERYPFD